MPERLEHEGVVTPEEVTSGMRDRRSAYTLCADEALKNKDVVEVQVVSEPGDSPRVSRNRRRRWMRRPSNA